MRDTPNRCWKYNRAPPESGGWFSVLSIFPSINNTEAGHGRKHPACGFHGTIVNGDVINA